MADKPKFKAPKNPADAADRAYKLREERYALSRTVALYQEEETYLNNYLIDNLPKSDASGITGRVAHAEIKVKAVPQVNNWPLFYKHILKTKDFSLMQRRANNGAIEERWDAKMAVPGVGFLAYCYDTEGNVICVMEAEAK